MLEKDPDHRISLTAAINHPWVTVEGSVRSETLSITEEPGVSGGVGVQVGLLCMFVCLCDVAWAHTGLRSCRPLCARVNIFL